MNPYYYTKRILLICLTAILSCSYSIAQVEPIVGGSSTTIEEHPWQVLIRGLGYCGGSIIGDQWVITATHCGIRPGDQVYIGMTRFNFGTNRPIDAQQTLSVAQVYSVPSYGNQAVCGAAGCPFFGDDLTIIRLNGTIDLSTPKAKAIEPLWGDVLEADPNNPGRQRFPIGLTGYASGWGEQTYQANNNPEQLKVTVALPTINAASAGVDAMFYRGTIGQHTQFAAGTIGQSGQDACRGDSGGPFVVQDNTGEWRLAGVTSWGFDCGEANRKGFWASVPHFEDFIKNTTGLFQGPTAGFAVSPADPQCVGEDVSFTNSSSGATSYTWTFDGASIAQSGDENPTIQFTEPGTHTVKLVASDGTNTDEMEMDFTIEQTTIDADDVIACQEFSFIEISANSNQQNAVFNWFETANSNTSLYTGQYFQTDIGASTTSFFVEAGPGITMTEDKVGKSNPNNASSHGGGQALVLDVNEEFVLETAIIRADNAGNRTLELRNSQGNLLDSKTINVPTGSNRVTINMTIPVGNDLELGFPTNSNLYRDDSGVQYPYDDNNDIVTITSSTAGGDYYYYLYDWEIRSEIAAGPACLSERVEVEITVDPNFSGCVLGVNDYNSRQSLSMYPNPSNGTFFLELEEEAEIVITDLSGGQVQSLALGLGRHEVSGLSSGVYFLRSATATHNETHKLVIK